MKKILFSSLLIAFFISSQLAFGDAIIDVTKTPDIPIFKGWISIKPIETEIASFEYLSRLEGDITEASISGEWGSTKIYGLLQLALYLDDILLIDFREYYRGLSRPEKRAFRWALRQGETIPFNIDIPEADWGSLEDGEASLYLVGKPKFFSSLILGGITLQIIDPVVPDGNGTPVPEPTTMLLLGSGLVGLWGLRRKFKK